MRRTTSTGTDLKRAAVLAQLGVQGPSSRADLARDLSVSPALMTQIVRGLLADGLVEEFEPEVAIYGGRPSRRLGLTSNSARALGMKIVADHVAFVEVGVDGQVLRSSSAPLDASSPLAPTQIAALAGEFLAQSQGATFLGVGVGVPGSVEHQGEGIVDSTQLGWNRVPLGDTLRNGLGLPVAIDNNVNALSVAERLFGCGRESSDFAVVTIGTGVGAGIISDGRVLRGFRGGAGDLGHVPMDPNGPRCQCGNLGCLEAFIGERALVSSAMDRGAIRPEGTYEDLLSTAREGNEQAQGVFAQAGTLFGRALAGVLNVVDPELVIILGEGVVAWPFWHDTFENSLRSALVPSKRGIPVVVENWDEDRWAQGAAALVLAAPFDSLDDSGSQGHIIRTRLVSQAGAHA